jgi:uncharacterized protein (TIGR03437 family)
MPGNRQMFRGVGSAFFFLFYASAVYGQVPVISPFGVVNSASYTAGGSSGNGIGPGSIAVLFGVNLARGTAFPDPLLLSTELEGTRVTVGGIAAYLMYVSPNQIDFQMPLNVSGRTTVVVSTPSGNSLSYPITAESSFGVFTMGTAGCGAAGALNANPDGTLSLNTPSSSVSPGDVISIFGTGLYPMSLAVPDGALAPSSPLATYAGPLGGTQFDLDGEVSPNTWVGLTPGLVGVDQVNVVVPSGVREGCAVPLRVFAGTPGSSKPVTVAVRRGGGQCSDPVEAGYGRIQWVKSIIQGDGPTIEIDSVAVSLQASPGKQMPPARRFADGKAESGISQNGGAECAVPGYRSAVSNRSFSQLAAQYEREVRP